jgi:deazaflavin-dependent oxidoreductase (nitroreductase family)
VIAGFFRLLARLTAPLVGILAGRRFLTIWAMVEYTGRKSGKRYQIPLALHRTPDGFIFPIAFGRGTQWPLNVVAAGGCTMRWNGRTLEVTDPRIVGADVGIPAFAPLERPILRAIRTERFLIVRGGPPG